MNLLIKTSRKFLTLELKLGEIPGFLPFRISTIDMYRLLFIYCTSNSNCVTHALAAHTSLSRFICRSFRIILSGSGNAAMLTLSPSTYHRWYKRSLCKRQTVVKVLIASEPEPFREIRYASLINSFPTCIFYEIVINRLKTKTKTKFPF